MFLWGFLVFGIALISIFWRNWKLVVAGFCILFFIVGIWRQTTVAQDTEDNQLQYFHDQEDVTIIGVVGYDPDVRSDKIKLTIKSEKLTFDSQPLVISGKILVTTNRYPEYQYGDKLEIAGKLLTPKEFEDFNYKEYLAKSGIYSVIYYPKIKILNRGGGNFVYETLFFIKNKLEDNLRKIMSPPQEGILEALLFGDESNISDDWKNKLNITGVRHITAVSGMNITIIARLLMGFLIAIGFWRKHAFYIAVGLLVLYIIMIGAPASALRAGIMGGLMLLAMQAGRLNQAWRAIIFAATVMAALNPMILRFDVGFQLSFLAVLGMILIQPYLRQKFHKIPKAFSLRDTISTTLAAQVFTLPILVYNFGRIPIFGLPANILIVPLLSYITVFGFILGFAAMIFLPLGQILSWFFWPFLSYIILLVAGFFSLPFSSISFENVHWAWIIIGYIIIGAAIFFIRKKSRETQSLSLS